MKAQKVLGIMSGTSLDGVDYALCEIGPKDIKLKSLTRVGYPRELKQKIMDAANNRLSSYGVAQLHHDLGRFYAKHAPRANCDYVGLHGQTIFHNPDKKSAATFQIGEPSYLSARLGVPVISQFRNMDLALGGQGAPLATLFHRAVFSSRDKNVAVNNLGGISNVTFLPAQSAGGGTAEKRILSFDTGPANILMDLAVKRFTNGKKQYDIDGAMAEKGIPHEGLVDSWIARHGFFKLRPPKSTGREDYGDELLEKQLKDARRARLNNNDVIATLAEFTARSIADAYAKFLPVFPDVVILCGGGAVNRHLVGRIRYNLREAQWRKFGGKISKPVDVTTTDALGWPSQAIEAAAFALLAYRTKNNLSGNLPATTGARRAAILGQITPAP